MVDIVENELSLTGVNKIYKSKNQKEETFALKDVNMTIRKGSIFGLLGPNGAGKSTLINILAGVVNKTSGEVLVSGINQDLDPQAFAYKIGYVPQEITLDYYLTVYEAIDIYSGMFGIAKKERRTKEIVEALGLGDKLYVRISALSGGMKRRVLVAKALVQKPSLLILDEPTAGVDVVLRDQLWEYVKQLNKQGTTILLTTHYLQEAEALCDDIAIINHGKIIIQDTKEKLLDSLKRSLVLIKVAEGLLELPQDFIDINAKLIAPNYIQVEIDASLLLNDVIILLHKHNLNITEIKTDEVSLEEVFRHIIKEDKDSNTVNSSNDQISKINS